MADAKKDRTRALTFSSEGTVVQRWYGGERLDHSADAVRMDFMNSGNAPLLLYHDQRQIIGVIESANIGRDKKGHAMARFGRSDDAQEALDNADDGIGTNVSVGYRLHEMTLESSKDGYDVYRITDWEPFESSIVSVPADPVVGIGRGTQHVSMDAHTRGSEHAAAGEETRASPNAEQPTTPREGNTMTTETAGTAGKEGAGSGNGAAAEAARAAAAAGNGNGNGSGGGVQTPRGPSAMEVEQGRIRAITNMCDACEVKDEGMIKRWISSGAKVEDVSEEVMAIVKHRGELNRKSVVPQLDLSAGEVRRFSIVRAIKACSENDWKEAGFEAECSREISKRLQKVPDSKKFYVPYDVQQRSIEPAAIASTRRALNMRGVAPWQQRADTVGTSAAGGYLVETMNLGFIELLRNRAVLYRMGATQLSGLVGNVNVPKQTAPGTPYWLASETTQITEAEQTFAQLPLSPHTVGAYTEISRLLLLQSSPGVEGIVNADLAAVSALAVDLGGLVGTGSSGQPTGIKNASGVGVAASGDMSTIAYTGQLDYQVAVANANVVPSRGGYVTTPTVASKLMQRTRFANTATPLWDGNLWDANGPLAAAGFPGMSSNQMPASAMYFGDWESLVIAEWGVLEIEVNPYANFQAGIIGIRAMMTIDVGLRYPAAFCIQGANIT